jgi:hypothetical protein
MHVVDVCIRKLGVIYVVIMSMRQERDPETDSPGRARYPHANGGTAGAVIIEHRALSAYPCGARPAFLRAVE